jgi:hypothetical protein
METAEHGIREQSFGVRDQGEAFSAEDGYEKRSSAMQGNFFKTALLPVTNP